MTQEYFSYTRKEIFPLLPEKVSSVLEIGCGTGSTLEWIHSIKHCALMLGVEISPDVAALARRKVNEVYAGNIEHMNLPVDKCSLDLILCLDVLEHLVDPWVVVRRLRELLKPGGALIASIPNVGHHTVLFPLLFKQQWSYTEAGILDKTHLRFFVRDTVIHLVESSGLKVDMITSTGLGRSRSSRVVNSLLPSLITSLFEKQYLVRGVRVD